MQGMLGGTLKMLTTVCNCCDGVADVQLVLVRSSLLFKSSIGGKIGASLSLQLLSA